MPAPHVSFSQLPSQKPQRPVTSDQTTGAMATHFFSCPLTPLPAQESASLLCSRQSATLCRRSTPRSHQSRRIFCALAMVSTFVFSFACPLTTIVLLSHLIFWINFLSSAGARGQVSWFLRGRATRFFLFFFSVALSHRREQTVRHVFHAERSLRHELCPVVLLTCPLRHRSVP